MEILKRNQEKLKINYIFFLILLWIALVSSFDAYLTVYFQNLMEDHELNPFARLIMAANDWDISLFIGIKMFGTILSLWILTILYIVKNKYVYCVTYCIGVFQTILLIYLLW